ncbi:MAG: DnaA/Hda family protein, partial [Paracoccaceae bacterium]|nr:DnaA/Hda family protein [Paracoccaceae bacterium]
MTEDQWSDIQKTLKITIGQSNYVNWIRPLGFNGVIDGVALFDVPTNFLGNYVDQNFGDVLLAQLGLIVPDIRRIRFQVPAAPTTREQPTSATYEKTNAVPANVSPDEKLPSAPLDKRFTFDTFVVGKPNELAHAAARRVAEGGPVSFNPLFLYGGVGLGKTHLMHAISWEMQNRCPAMRVLYLSAEQFMYRFVQALRDRKMMDFKELFR